jgi:hypothetical protein
MAAADHTRAAAARADGERDEAAREARKRRLYAGILAGFVHDLSAARGPRPAARHELAPPGAADLLPET